MTEEKVLMEKFKGFDIFYDKEKERFVADKKELNIHFEARTLWEIRGYIKESRVEEVDKYYYIKAGYFNHEIQKIHIMTKNKELKEGEYKIVDTTEGSNYDLNRLKKGDLPKLYDINEHNVALFDKVAKLRKSVDELENKQSELIDQMK